MKKSQLVQTSKGPVEYVLSGSGPVVLVCHGTSSDCYASELSGPLVEAGFSVLVPSRPGYGRTPLEVGLSAAQAAQALQAMLECLSIRTCSVIGISGGGPTAIALASGVPQVVERLVLLAAQSYPEHRPSEPGYKNQNAFYGPMHSITWGVLGLMGRLSPRRMARQTLEIFSTHDPDEGLSKITEKDIDQICAFYQGHSSRRGALNDATHTVGEGVLASIHQPTLVVHSRCDNSVPFAHAEWSLKHIPQAELCEGGFTGHGFWIGPDFPLISQRLIGFLKG